MMAKHCSRQSRRWLLQVVALAASGGGVRADDAVPAASATPNQSTGTSWHKFSKQVAGYVDRGKRGPETCGLCHYFIDPDQCVIVEGPVNPVSGWCNYGATTG
jgi:hypothetical protein